MTTHPNEQPTVVVADDSPVMRRIVGSVLEKAGYHVVLAEDGVDAVQACMRTLPDAVVLDVQMPRLSGYVAARVLKDDWRTADVPVLFLTSLSAASDRYWAAQAGATRFLTKDFEAPELESAVAAALEAAALARGGRSAVKADPVELTDDDVLARVADLLDRKLFEASVTADVAAIATEVWGFEETVAAVLETLGRVVDCDLVGVLLLEESTTYIGVQAPASLAHHDAFVASVCDAAAQAVGPDFDRAGVASRVADPSHQLGTAGGFEVDADEPMATFLSMPLRAGGRTLGLLAMSSATPHAFGESALATLRLVAGPAAVVIAHARLAGTPVS